MEKDSLTCVKCGTFYEDAYEGFYWETRIGNWRRPCKKCISEYNKSEEQRKKKNAYNRKYFQKKRDEDKAAGRPNRYDYRKGKKKTAHHHATRQVRHLAN